MCGIIANLTQEESKQYQAVVESADCHRMRGPDSRTIILNRTGLFLFDRLKINDLSMSGNQPFTDRHERDGEVHDLLLMCNGEIFNHVDLERQHNLTPKSKSDCECIMLLYKKIGMELTYNALNGDFAFVLVDENLSTKQVTYYFARDITGVRPLFYADTIVSSTVTPLIKMGLQPEEVLPGYLYTNFCPEDKLIRRGMTLLPSFDDQCASIRTILEKAVQSRLMSDRPIGCLLSGGLDSSIITALLVNLLGPDKVRTYSVGMEGSTDLKYARILADYLKTTHTEVKFTPQEGFDLIPDVIERLGSSDITTIRASVGMYILAKYIREHTDDTVIFSGEGSDELFCGYLYWHNSPSVSESANESVRLYENLHLYDVLRADRMISSNGLELRVPFLDKDVISFAFSCNQLYKTPQASPGSPVEKYLLRRAFEHLLPPCIAWRQKVAFSDGVSELSKSWYEIIQEKVDGIIPSVLFDKNKYKTKEHQYYRMIFERLFPGYDFKTPVWLPRWSNATDPSARQLSVCREV